MKEIKSSPWNITKIEVDLNDSFTNNSETDLLKILRDNSFLFYYLYSRKGSIQPVFREVSFGSKLRCDFAWLNDNSGGPEWVLMELEKPKMKLFKADGKPTAELNNSIEQVNSWQRYFHENPLEGKRIFGAVAKFRFLVVAGDTEEWSGENAMRWKSYNNSNNSIEIRTSDVFYRALKNIRERPSDFWSFEEHPVTLEFTKLESYWKKYRYMDKMRKIF